MKKKLLIASIIIGALACFAANKQICNEKPDGEKVNNCKWATDNPNECKGGCTQKCYDGCHECTDEDNSTCDSSSPLPQCISYTKSTTCTSFAVCRCNFGWKEDTDSRKKMPDGCHST